MDEKSLVELLRAFKNNEKTLDQAVDALKTLPFTDLLYATIDHHRALRVGYPEVVFCEGKTVEQVAEIMHHLSCTGANVLGTRATEEMYKGVLKHVPHARYNPLGKTITIKHNEPTLSEGKIVIVAAGTSDLPVVEEAYETAMIFGNTTEKIIDVGVAGIHRLFARLEDINKAKVIIVVAGMEGALASVLGGLVSQPIIAVPTSVGYGANFKGVSALLTMLNSCASGVTVVNIDNGFGAAYAASQINKL